MCSGQYLQDSASTISHRRNASLHCSTEQLLNSRLNKAHAGSCAATDHPWMARSTEKRLNVLHQTLRQATTGDELCTCAGSNPAAAVRCSPCHQPTAPPPPYHPLPPTPSTTTPSTLDKYTRRETSQLQTLPAALRSTVESYATLTSAAVACCLLLAAAAAATTAGLQTGQPRPQTPPAFRC